jgi:peptidoglycan hydrolase-like protein with peptidoglycan-binding domain
MKKPARRPPPRYKQTMKKTMRNNRPEGRAYDAQRQRQPREAAIRPGGAEPLARGRAAAQAKPGRIAFKGFPAALLGSFRRLTTAQVAVLSLTAFLCVSVPVALAVFLKPGAAPAAESQSLLSPSDGGSAILAESPFPSPQSPTPDPTPTLPPSPTSTIFDIGISAPVIAQIQARLMDLGYMDEDEPTEYFGPVTSAAVSLFQRQHKLSVDGTVGDETYAMLMNPDAQNYMVMEGDSGSDVKELQARLRELGYIDTAPGNFGEQTTKAVKAFQQNNRIAADGKVGQKTFELLYSDNVKPNFQKYADQSGKLKTYQTKLKTLGYLTTTPDGKYGQDTILAVKRFQEINDLFQDGFLGPSTVSLLTSGRARANTLMLGMQGNDVTKVQTRLKALGYTSHVTGYFGSETEDGVKAFQKRNGLSADGTVGTQTRTKLESGSAKKASGSGGGSGSSSAPATGVDKLISVAQSKLGCKYVWGAKGPSTFDCSGFVYYCLNHAGVKAGYLTSEGWAACAKYQKITSTGSLKKGDILVFSGTSVGHVGIYLGNGCMIDASSANGKVVKRSGLWSSSYWKGAFICGFRVY